MYSTHWLQPQTKRALGWVFLTHRAANIHNARLLVALDVWMYSPVWHFSLWALWYQLYLQWLNGIKHMIWIICFPWILFYAFQTLCCRLFLTIFLTRAWCLQSRAPSGPYWCCCLSNLLPTYFLNSCLIYSHHIVITISRPPATWKYHQLYRMRPLYGNVQPVKVC